MSYIRYERRAQAIWQPGAYGALTDAACFRVFDLSFDPETAEAIETGCYFGQPYPDVGAVGRRMSEINLKVYIRGSDTQNLPPPEAGLLRSCAFDEASSGTTPNIVWNYTHGDPHLISGSPAGDLNPLPALTVNYDNRQYIATNLVGDVSMVFPAGKLPYYDFKYKGVISAVATTHATSGFSETAQTVALTAGSSAVPVYSEALTITPSGGSPYTPAFTEVAYHAMNKVEENPDGNSVGGANIPYISQMGCELALKIREDLLASYDPWTQWLAGTYQTIAWKHNPSGSVRQVLNCTYIGRFKEQPKVTKIGGVQYWDLRLSQNPGSNRFKFWWS